MGRRFRVSSSGLADVGDATTSLQAGGAEPKTVEVVTHAQLSAPSGFLPDPSVAALPGAVVATESDVIERLQDGTAVTGKANENTLILHGRTIIIGSRSAVARLRRLTEKNAISNEIRSTHLERAKKPTRFYD